MEILRHSRPLFAQIALEYMQDNPYIDGCDLNNNLNAMVKTLASRISFLKKRLKVFEIDQVCLLLCTSYRIVEDEVNIIDGHFARLVEQSAFELQIDADQGLRKDNEPWEFRCVLPPPEEDILLHLTMTGGLIISSIREVFVYSDVEDPTYNSLWQHRAALE